VVTKFGECASWELDTDGYKVSSVRLPPFDQSALASNSPKAAVVTDKAVLVADLVSGTGSRSEWMRRTGHSPWRPR